MRRQRVLFVTGKLAEPALRRLLDELAPRLGMDHTVAVLPITVAALATTKWIASHLTPRGQFERLVVPGLCQGELGDLASLFPGACIERGPEDLRDLPEFFGQSGGEARDYGAHDLTILAEINHAPRLALAEIVRQARHLSEQGADIIDLGCDPGAPWQGVGEAVRALRDQGQRVSVDTFHPEEAAAGARAGAELVLSVNRSNREQATDWGCEVVAIPDEPANLGGLDETIAALEAAGVPHRIDAILEPIGFGFAASIGRYLEVRRRYPAAEMLMGVGNVTELTDVDSAGVNVLLAGFCQEVGIRSVLTTQVINWCQSAVRELDLARRLMHHAFKNKTLPKRLEPRLVMLRDPKLRTHGEEALAELARQITDRNVRLFAEGGVLHVINGAMHLKGDDPFALFEAMAAQEQIGAAHAFYLGYEMAKAVTALTLGKNYVQDRALDWGFLTRHEKHRPLPPPGQP